MRKLFIAITFLFLFLLNAAQTNAQVRFGLKGGGNLATAAFSDDYNSVFEFLNRTELKPGMVPSFLVGAQVEFDFTPKFGLGLGLQLNGKGYQYDFDYTFQDSVTNYKFQSKPLYVQAPVHLYFRSNGFFIGAGPYFAYGIGGKYVQTTTFGGNEDKTEGSLEFTNDYNPSQTEEPGLLYNPFDYGVGAELGYEFGRIRISASYNFGLANTFSKEYADYIKANTEYEFTGSNRVIGLAVTYLVGSGE
jgi:hypothetical protein